MNPSRVWGYEFDGFVLDAQRRVVHRRDGTPVRLTARLFNTLLLFVEHPGELLGKDWLMDAIWPGMDVGENSLSQIICSLRRALSGGGRGCIQTESRHGFRFACTVRPLPASPMPHAGGAAIAGSPQAVMEALSLIMAMQTVIARQLTEALAAPISDRSSYPAPSRTPAFPV